MKIGIPPFEQGRVLVVGDLMLDRYWHGETSRISPEAPVPVVAVRDAEERPGGAGNVALNIAALRTRVTVMGLTGADEAADVLAQRLAQAGVDCRLIRRPEFATVTKLRVLSRHQQLIRLDFEDNFARGDLKEVRDSFPALAREADVVLLSDYGKGTLHEVQALIAAARALGKPVLVDPKGSDFSRYRGATVLTPNLAEFEAIVGHCTGDEDLVARGEALRRELQLEALLITRSQRGMTLLRENHPPLHLPARAREVYDVTGAGDTAIAVLAAACAVGTDLAEATALANIAAGVVVGKLGTATVSLQELDHALYDQDKIESGVTEADELLRRVARARARGETVVMTNGCFDILHAGHVSYLDQARRLGDRLVVAVNDDASVKRLKGADRPVNALAQRAAVLAALQSVDWVVPFSEDTPEQLICHVQPDVLVKGGDYNAADVAGGDCVRARGGRVVILDYVENCSTSRIIEAIRHGVAPRGGDTGK
ncbi:MAG: bifunctional D-glycero-beta-D-manno-heptose-7-phosphate kinase/D-glycero-beta-D-manno-heptose 1-phosphate adenylyltransferase HldE [Gammaproteobacteria bacterium]|nr:bifunctional D-glycero-beta-D-manno-heptose-7-phosphate kinase/D-glycero-beta-D-manno-heptose 1-phosphate adenylyltransferase HldE [Gammaproteobacteria bacterium]